MAGRGGSRRCGHGGFVHEGERGSRREREPESEGGVSTGLVHVSWARGWEEGGVDTAKQEVAGARLRASATRARPSGKRKTTGGGGLGQVAGLADWAGQVGCR